MTILPIVTAIVAAPVLAWAGSALLGRIVALLPLGAQGRDAALRWLPAGQLAITAAIAAGVVFFLFDVNTTLIALALIAVVVTVSAWFAIRDIITGVVLRAEHGFAAGQVVTFDGINGRITAVGIRSIEVETTDGSRLSVPWFRVQRSLVALTDGRDRSGAQQLTIRLPRTVDPVADIEAIRTTILHSAFSTIRHDPHIRITTEDPDSITYDVTVYTIDPSFTPAIEREIRERLRPER